MKKNNGITLIALIITIIIMLILVAVTVSMLVSSGLLGKSKQAVHDTAVSSEIEALQLAVLSALSEEEYGVLTTGKICNELQYYEDIENVRVFGDEVEVTFKSKRAYLIDAIGEITQMKPREYSDEVKAALTLGKYVTYKGQTYRVLYDVNSGYNWIEIVSVNTLGHVTIGYTDPRVPSNTELVQQGYGTTSLEKARWSYNNAVETLFLSAQGYLSELADRARCVGSDPRYPERDVQELGYAVKNTDVNAYIITKGYNYKFKMPDTSYTNEFGDTTLPRDLQQLNKIGARRSINLEDYWFPSRWIDGSARWTDVGLYYVHCDGSNNILHEGLIRVSGAAGSMSCRS